MGKNIPYRAVGRHMRAMVGSAPRLSTNKHCIDRTLPTRAVGRYTLAAGPCLGRIAVHIMNAKLENAIGWLHCDSNVGMSNGMYMLLQDL